MEEIVADIAGQPADFKINWGSEGVKYFINTNENLTSYKKWLFQFISALEGENRDAILDTLKRLSNRFKEESRD